MSLRRLNPRTRRRLRLHGWLLVGWCLSVGLATSWLLLHGMHLASPMARYTINAIVIYGLGLVVGVRWWLSHFASLIQREAHLAELASAEEKAFDVEREDKAKNSSDSDWLDGISELFSFDEGAWLLLIPALVLLVLMGALSWMGMSSALFADGLASLLAEVALQFVIGTLIARRTLRRAPADPGDALLGIVGKTWFAGVLLVAASALFGAWLQYLHPQAVSIVDLFR